MKSKNDITGNNIKTKVPSKEYLENYDNIFKNQIRKKREIQEWEDSIYKDEYYDVHPE